MERKVWYDRPAASWTEAMPLGNGRLGMMIYGGVERETLQLSEESMWSGYAHDYDNPECREHLDEMRALIFAGKIAEAEELCYRYLVCRGRGSFETKDGQPFGSFQPAGDLSIESSGMENAFFATDNYRREIDLIDGVATVSFADVVRRTVASEKYEVTLTEIKQEIPRSYKICFTPTQSAANVTVGNGDFTVTGRFLGEGALSYATYIRLECDGQMWGGADSEGPGVFVANARTVRVWTATETDYREPGKDPLALARSRVETAIAAGAEAVFADHIARHSEVMERCTLDLGEGPDIPTDKRMEGIRAGKSDPAFSALYFAFGRYLLMACSRGKLPSNLQGLWAKDGTPPWSADYHININVQMMYWHAENTALSEYTAPLFDYTEYLSKFGKHTAEVQYGCRGWVAHTTPNAHGMTAPGQDPSWGAFTCAGAWCCLHMWEHYRFTGDAEFLRRYYPVMRDSALFFVDFLAEDPRNGYLVTVPSNSPENHYVDPKTGKICSMCAGPTMDNTIIAALFDCVAKAADILGEDADFAETLRGMQKRLPPLKIGENGRILEWQEEYEEPEPGHRHMSHLFGLYPGDVITAEKTPDLFRAARASLEGRLANGGGHTGWSLAWIVNFYARLFDGDNAAHSLNHLFANGTFRNLFDRHPTVFFQIDGNYGATAGIAEMLLQSHEDEIRVLPALPKEWANGSFKGLRARGGFAIDASWKDGEICFLKVRALHAGKLAIRAGEQHFARVMQEGDEALLIG